MKKKLTNKQKKLLNGLLVKASNAFALGRMDILAQLCKQIDSVQQSHPDVNHYRGVIAMQSGDADAAIDYFRSAIAAAPGRCVFYVNLGAALLLQNKVCDALAAYQQALTLDKRELAAHLGYAQCLLQMDKPVQAIEWLQQLPARYQRDTGASMLAFRACYNAVRMGDARQHLLRVLQLQPGHAGAHYGLALLAAAAGRFEEAISEVQATLAADAGHADAYKVLADIHRFSDPDDPYLLAMHALYQQPNLSTAKRAVLAFALGKAMHDLAQYDRAFQFYQKANTLRHSAMTYDHAGELARIHAVITTNAELLTSGSSSVDDVVPIFIVGMPRCGSTLVEQILAAHPDVESRGECGLFQQVMQDLRAPGAFLADQDMNDAAQWCALGEAYLARLKTKGVGHVTDKTLPNMLCLGAIHAALPQAKIVHVRRNPIDTCLSIYRNDLRGQDMQFGFDLNELGEYYVAYQQLMQHWREVLPPGVMYELDYESLIADQTGETRRLLVACGLIWHEQCLQFSQVRNHVFTASAVQVRSGINTGSLAAWRRYEKHLQPLIRILGEPA